MVGTLFIGFDAMDVHLTRAWAADGLLPNFAQLFDSWSSRPTQNPEGLLVGGLWPTFWSAAGPAHHGSYCWQQFLPGTYTAARLDPTDFDSPPFWLTLDEAGKRCAVFDVPLVRPIPLRHGVHVVDWGSHDSQLDFTATDPRVREQLDALGPFPQKRCDLTVSQDGREHLVSLLRQGFAMRTAAVLSLLDGDYDVVMAVVSETHCTGHQLFHLHDQAHPLHDAAMRERIGGDPLLLMYQEADRMLGTLLDRVGDGASIMVLLSHGFGRHYDGSPMLGELLQRLSNHHHPASPIVRQRERLLRLLQGARRRAQRRLFPNRRHPRDVRNVEGAAAWFDVPNNDLYGAVRANVIGREPRGRIAPGRDLETALGTITEELLALRHESTGTPAVRRVLRTDDYHRGPRSDMLPDLLVEWNWDEPFTALTSPTVGVVRCTDVPQRTGDHRPHGAVFVRNLSLPDGISVRVESLGQVLIDGAMKPTA